MASPVGLSYRSCDTDSNWQDPRIVCNPIRGLVNVPVLTLLETVGSLVHLVTYISDFAHFALQFAELVNEKPSGMTRDQIAAINLYTSAWDSPEESLYCKLNQHLRSEDRSGLKPYFPFLKLILTALNQLPAQRGTVWRGIRADVTKSYKVGQISTMWGFSSCTLDMKTLEGPTFMGQNGDRTLLGIETRSGRSICPFSHFKNEAEILLPPGVSVKVTNLLNAGHGLNIIYLTEIDSPVPAIDFESTKSVEVEASGQKDAGQGAFDMGLLRKSLDPDCIDAILWWMRENIQDAKVQEEGCVALRKMAEGADNVRALGDKGAIRVVLSGMKVHSQSPRVQGQGCFALRNLALDNDSNIREIMQKGGVEIIVSGMRQNIQDARVQENGCFILKRMAQGVDNVRRLSEQGAVEVIISGMQAHSINSGVQREGCFALGKLVFRNESNRREIMQKGGVEIILLGMKQNIQDATLQENGCFILRRMAEGVDNVHTLGEQGAVEAIISGMKAHSKNSGVQREGCSALGELASRNESNRRKIMQKGGVEIILLGMRQNIQDAKVQENGCFILRKMAEDVDNVNTLREQGAVKAIMSGMKAHSKSAGVQHQGCSALGNLA